MLGICRLTHFSQVIALISYIHMCAFTPLMSDQLTHLLHSVDHYGVQIPVVLLVPCTTMEPLKGKIWVVEAFSAYIHVNIKETTTAILIYEPSQVGPPHTAYSWQILYQLSYQGSSAGRAESLRVTQN